MKFYLGSHLPNWLNFSHIPLFVSRRTLTKYKKLPVAKTEWALDSGGFTELSMFGKWTINAENYAKEVKRFYDNIGKMDFCSIQDWMCEPFILNKTGLTVKEHQLLSVKNYLELKSFEPSLPWMPVLQGFNKSEYLECIDLYNKYGIDLTLQPQVGLGSVCRRQHTQEIADLVIKIHSYGIKLHGFGVKTQGLKLIKNYLKSSDSLAWSYAARYSEKLPECTTHKNCANCWKYAQLWYNKIQKIINN